MVQLLLLMWPLFAGDVSSLRSAIADRATGVLHFAGLDETHRESVLYWDGQNYKISIAGLPSLILVPRMGSNDTRPYGDRRLPIEFYSWSQTNRGWSVDIMVDSDDILAEKHAKENLAPELVLPRARVTLKQFLTYPVASGRYFGADQDKSHAVPPEEKPPHVITFREVARDCAARILDDNRISVRK